MSNRTHSPGEVWKMRALVLTLASVFASALVFAVACAAQVAAEQANAAKASAAADRGWTLFLMTFLNLRTA